MPSTPLVSVVIPTRNRRQLLARALASVRNQTYRPLEIIVVDDGSDDGTLDDLGSAPDLTVLRLARSIGGAAARNRGVAASRGELIAFLDSDDEWLAPKLERQVEAILDASDVGAIYCRHFSHDDVTGVTSEAATTLYTGKITNELMSGRCPRTVSLFLVRREALESVGGFDETLTGFQDTDLWIRMAERWMFDAVDEPLAIVHNHGEVRVTTDIEARRAALSSFLEKWGTEMEHRIGSDGVRRYRRNQLAVAQGAVVLNRVRLGRRMEAFGALGGYLGVAGLSNPAQLLGLFVACVAGEAAHTRLKRLRQQASR